MNYIKQLQSENESLREQLKSVEQGLIHLKSYVNSPKFYPKAMESQNDNLNHYVHCNDINMRVSEIISLISL
jgi:hypothetical protein